MNKSKIILLSLFGFCLIGVSRGQDRANPPQETALRRSVVSVVSYDHSAHVIAKGTGFFITETGDIMTRHNLLPPEAARSEIITADGARYQLGSIVSVDEKTGIVRVSLVNQPQNVKPLPSSTFSTQAGDAVLIITGDGPAGREIKGVVTTVDRDVQRTFRVAAAFPEDSNGSPIINAKGQVVGVVISTTAGGHNCSANLIETVRSLYPQDAGFQPVGLIKEDSPAGFVEKSDGVRQGVAIKRVAPAYPHIAKRLRVDGRIIFEVLVDENGDVISAKPISVKLRCHIEGKEVAPEAEAALKQAALDSILQWKFSPSTKNGEPVKVLGTIPVNFNL